MKQLKTLTFLVLTILCFYGAQAQTSATIGLTEEPANANEVTQQKTDALAGKWTLGFGLNIIEDDGGSHVFEIYNDETSHFSMPFAFSAEYGLKNSFSLVSRLSLNKYKAGKSVNGNILTDAKEPMYFALDFMTKYSFRELLKTRSFDPYIMAGPGYLNIGEYSTLNQSSISGIHKVPANGKFTFNVAVGLNYWINDEWGVGADGLARLGKNGENKDLRDYQTQLTFGVFYRLPERYKFHKSWR